VPDPDAVDRTSCRLWTGSGIDKIRNGKFAEARTALQLLIDLFPNDGSVPLANWSMGLAYFKEGGRENFRKAADKFKEFDLGYDYEPDLEELQQAAEINVALIELDLMKSATGEMLRSEMTAQKVGEAVLGLKSFLANWPDSQFAPAAQAALREIMDLTSPH
jgi:outer membrane protein assembly factor BamD (BamD/ComL family)